MLKETITYRNLDDEEVTEVHYFHLTEAEIIEFEAQYGEQGPQEVIEQMTQTRNYSELLKLFKQIVLMTYGRREGQRFVKNEELTSAFIETGAFSALFLKCFQDPEYFANFLAGAVPRDLGRKMDTKQVVAEATQAVMPPPPPPVTHSTPSV